MGDVIEKGGISYDKDRWDVARNRKPGSITNLRKSEKEREMLKEQAKKQPKVADKGWRNAVRFPCAAPGDGRRHRAPRPGKRRPARADLFWQL